MISRVLNWILGFQNYLNQKKEVHKYPKKRFSLSSIIGWVVSLFSARNVVKDKCRMCDLCDVRRIRASQILQCLMTALDDYSEHLPFRPCQFLTQGSNSGFKPYFSFSTRLDNE